MYKTEYRYWTEDNGVLYDSEINIPSLQGLFKNVVYAHNPDRLYYFNANHLGSGSLITDEHGQTYQTLIYAPHGEVLLNKFYGDYDEPYKFTGFERDNESGLDYMGARYRNVEATIPLSTDRFWFQTPHLTPYHFAGNNPIMSIDVNGDSAWSVTRNWDEYDSQQFQQFSAERLKYLEGEKIDCADLALTLIVDYASENGLPLTLTNKSGKTFDSNSDNYNSVEEYKFGYIGKNGRLEGGVLPNIQSQDIPSNTFTVDRKDAVVGDMQVISKPWGHIVIYNSVPRDGNGKEVGQRRISYGNFNSATGRAESVRYNKYDFTAHNPTGIINADGTRGSLSLTYVPNRNVVHRWNVFKTK